MGKSLSIVLLILGQYFGFAQSSLQKSEIVGSVNGEPISNEEFAFFAQRNKFKVISSYRNNHNLDYHADFWNDKSTKKSPGDMLKSMALDNIVNVKVQFILAKQYGIIDDISFQAVKQYMEWENKQRAEALNKNIVIYGPEQYSMENYFDYLTSNMIIKLKDYMVRNEIIRVDVSQDAMGYNNPNKKVKGKHQFSQAHMIRTQINQQYDEIISEMVKKAKVKINKKQMKNQSF